MKGVLLAICAVLLVALLYWHGTTVELIADLPEPTGDTGQAAEPEEAAEPAAPAGASGSATGPDEPATRTLRIRVVDGSGESVADALVAIHELRDRRRGLQLWAGLSDASGRCQAAIRGRVLVSARKSDSGWSGDLFSGPEHETELRMELLPTAAVVGRVLNPSGRPLEGAQVRGSCSTSGPKLCAELPLARTDSQGAFEIEVLAGHDYSFAAEHDRRTASSAVPKLSPGQRFDLMLQFDN